MTKKKDPEDLLKRGAPTKYREEHNELVFKLTLLGSTDKELAGIIGISEATLNTWKIKHPKFLESVKDGKEKADAEVAKSLYQKAKGYTVYEDVEGEDGKTKRVAVKEVPGDTRAQEFWLKNRKPKRWRDKQEIEVRQSLTDKSLEEIQAMIAAANKEIETLTSEDNQHKE